MHGQPRIKIYSRCLTNHKYSRFLTNHKYLKSLPECLTSFMLLTEHDIFSKYSEDQMGYQLVNTCLKCKLTAYPMPCVLTLS